MARFARLLLALSALPLAWGISLAFVDVVRMVPVPENSVMSPSLVAALAGVVTYLAVAMVLPPAVRVYVFGHELTHAVWGLLFGARVSNLRVGLRGGSVMLTKSNVWITLSPYFFPFYTMIVALAAVITRCFVSPLPWTPVWLFAIGFTWCFHCVFTLRSLAQEQPDVMEYGRVFSYVWIWIFNFLGLAAWIACTTEVTWSAFGHRLLARTGSAYVAVGGWAQWLYESVRSLPFLQR